MKNNDLENIKRLKNSIEFLPDNKMKDVTILEYCFYKQFLLATGDLNNSTLNLESDDLLKKEWELLRKSNRGAFQNIFDNIDIISEITNRILTIHSKYPINTQIYDEKVLKNIPEKELFKIMNDFFQGLGNDVYNIFIKLWENNYIKIINNKKNFNYSGASYDITSFSDFRIVLVDLKDPTLLYHTFVHEVGHCYDFFRNKTNKNINKYNIFEEVVSTVFEKLFAYFLIENGYYKQYGYDNLLQVKQYILKMNLINSFVNNAYKNKQIIFNKTIIGEFEISDDAFFDIDDQTLDFIDQYETKISNYFYVLADIISNNLVSMYFLDKKKGLIEIKNFITTMHQYSVLENLQRYALDFKSTEDEMKMLYNYQKKKFHL